MMTLTSAAFAHCGAIPAHHTCDGRDCSPALAWTGAVSYTHLTLPTTILV